MKVFIITKEPFPHGMAAVKRMICYAKAWQREGIRCEVLIYTRTERYGVKPKNTEGKGEFEGVPFRYMKGTPLRENNVVVRRINDYLDRFRLKGYLLQYLQRGDVVYAYNSCDRYSINIMKIAHIKGASFAVEMCELPFGTSDERTQQIKHRKNYELSFLPHVDGVITISDALSEYAMKHCSTQAHIGKVPILVDYPNFEMEDKSDEAEIPYIFHAGTLLQQKDGFLDMLKAFAIAAKRLPFEVRFISTGNPKGTRHEKEIKQIIHDNDLMDKVVFTGYLSDVELRDYLSKASFVVINKLTTRQNKYCFSTKLGEYMAASKAIIITRVGEAMNYLTHGKDAYIIEPNDTKALAAAMETLFSNADLRKHIGHNAQDTCKKNFTIDSNRMKLKKLMNVISGGVKSHS